MRDRGEEPNGKKKEFCPLRNQVPSEKRPRFGCYPGGGRKPCEQKKGKEDRAGSAKKGERRTSTTIMERREGWRTP